MYAEIAGRRTSTLRPWCRGAVLALSGKRFDAFSQMQWSYLADMPSCWPVNRIEPKPEPMKLARLLPNEPFQPWAVYPDFLLHTVAVTSTHRNRRIPVHCVPGIFHVLGYLHGWGCVVFVYNPWPALRGVQYLHIFLTAHYDIYRDRLTTTHPAFGHALWEPSPEARYGPVRIGDVSFVREGKFYRLFSVLYFLQMMYPMRESLYRIIMNHWSSMSQIIYRQARFSPTSTVPQGSALCLQNQSILPARDCNSYFNFLSR